MAEPFGSNLMNRSIYFGGCKWLLSSRLDCEYNCYYRNLYSTASLLAGWRFAQMDGRFSDIERMLGVLASAEAHRVVVDFLSLKASCAES